MDALPERVEVLAPACVAHDDLAVDHVAAWREAQLGEVARQRPVVARADLGLVTVDEDDRAKAVPLRLEGPAGLFRQAAPRARELRKERR